MLHYLVGNGFQGPAQRLLLYFINDNIMPVLSGLPRKMGTVTSFLALLNLSFEILQWKSNSPSFHCLLSNWSGPHSLGSWNVSLHCGSHEHSVGSLEGPAGPTEFHGAESLAEASTSPLK